MAENNNKKILLTGGGTAGSVTPLLAIAEELNSPLCIKGGRGDFSSEANPPLAENPLSSPLCKGDNMIPPLYKGGRGGFEFLWLGTKNGPERQMVEKEGIKFHAIFSGKLRRYFSWQNFISPFLILIGFVQSFFIMLKWRPDLVITAGSFVSVPVAWAAWLLRIPVLVHQQDARPGLANKLMAPFARAVTVTFEESLKDYGKKARWTGNPIRLRREIKNHPAVGGIKIKNNDKLPAVLIIGGGMGAMAINELVWQGLDELTKFCNVIHITGKDKTPPLIKGGRGDLNGYIFHEFLNIDQMSQIYAAADIVVSRAGMGVLTELAYLGKPAIIIPMPDSHQEDNAKIFQTKNVAVILNQKELDANRFVENIKKILGDEKLREQLSRNIRTVMKEGANKEVVEIINRLISTI